MSVFGELRRDSVEICFICELNVRLILYYLFILKMMIFEYSFLNVSRV